MIYFRFFEVEDEEVEMSDYFACDEDDWKVLFKYLSSSLKEHEAMNIQVFRCDCHDKT